MPFIYTALLFFFCSCSFARRLLFACIARDNKLYLHSTLRSYIYTSHHFAAEFLCFFFISVRRRRCTVKGTQTHTETDKQELYAYSRVRKEEASMNANNARKRHKGILISLHKRCFLFFFFVLPSSSVLFHIKWKINIFN